MQSLLCRNNNEGIVTTVCVISVGYKSGKTESVTNYLTGKYKNINISRYAGIYIYLKADGRVN